MMTALEYATVECGHAWDALRIPEPLGSRLLEALDAADLEHLGPVVGAEQSSCTYWLLTPGTPGQVWPFGCRVLSRGSCITLPDPGISPSWTRWLHTPDQRGQLTDPAWLADRLRTLTAKDAAVTTTTARDCSYCTTPGGDLVVSLRPGDPDSPRVALGAGHEACRLEHSEALRGLPGAVRAQGVCADCGELADGALVSEEGGASGGGGTVVRCDPCVADPGRRVRDEVRRWPL